ncbi:MAG TPA: DUF6766 family protein [Actinomycetota bacterium]|nr:DUF6766 family protein [Actinomycetota bacterium]
METHSHLKRWGAAYILLALFLASWVGQFVAMLIEIGDEARQHGQPFQISEFWPQFWSATFENWQSEWLQLFVQAVVLLGMKHVLFKADAQDMELVQLDLAEIKQHLGIPPRDAITAEELRDLERVKSRRASTT